MDRMHGIDGNLTVGRQPDREDLRRLAEHGYGTVIDLRHAGEPGHALSPAEEREAAEGAGLTYLHLPVSLDTLTPAVLARFRAAVAESDGRTYVHCAAGQRAAALALATRAASQGLSAYAVLAEAEGSGLMVHDPRARDFIHRIASPPDL